MCEEKNSQLQSMSNAIMCKDQYFAVKNSGDILSVLNFDFSNLKIRIQKTAKK